MGRNLFKAPLGVLVAQARDTRIHLERMDAVREAFVAAGQDLAGLEGELAAAIDAGVAASVAVGHAELAVQRATEVQGDVCATFVDWTRRARRRLEQAEASGDDDRVNAARKVRKRIGRYPGRWFTSTLATLRELVPELAAQAVCLRAADWNVDLVAEAERLLAAAESAGVDRDRAVRRHHQAGRCAADAREQMRGVLTTLRCAWDLSTEAHRDLPAMSLRRLEEYAALRNVPKGGG